MQRSGKSTFPELRNKAYRLYLKATAIFYRIINAAMLCTFVFAVIVTIDNMDTLIGVITRRIR